MTADHYVGLGIRRLYDKIAKATHKELEARLPALLHAFQTVADSDIDSATLSEVNDDDQLQLNTPTEPNTFMTSQDNLASTATRTHTCKITQSINYFVVDGLSQTFAGQSTVKND
jgi:hypothetical protein